MRKKHSCIKILIFFFLLLGGLVFILYFFPANIIRYSGQALGWQVSLKKADFLFHNGFGIQVEDLAIESKTHQIHSFQVDKMRVLFEPVSSKVLQGDFLIKEVMIQHPHLTLVYPEEKKEIAYQEEKVEQTSSEEVTGIFLPRKILVRNGQITVVPSDKEKQMEGFSIKDLSCRAMLDFSQAGKIELRVFELSLIAFGGTIKATGSLNLHPDATLSAYALNFEGGKLRLEKIIQALRLKSDAISGEGDVTGHLEDDDITSLEGMNGKINFSLRNGVINLFGIVGKIFQMMSPKAYIQGKIPGLSDRGTSFNSLNGTFTIENGICRTDKVLLKSHAWNILTMGDLDLLKEEMDMDYYIQPLQTLDAVISWIPIIGHILKDEDRGVLDIHFKVKGKIKDPEIESKQLSNMVDKVFGIIKRSLTLPLKLLPDNKEIPATGESPNN